VSKGTRGRPSNSWPPSSITTSARTSSARSAGQSTKGGSEAPEGRPMRTAATRPRSRRCTTALVKWVVPIIAASASRASGARLHQGGEGAGMPWSLRGGGVFTAVATDRPRGAAASVLVPPTSIRCADSCEHRAEVEDRSRRRAGPTCSIPFGGEQDGGAGSASTVTRWP
jgi:hypothetical protein